MLAFYSIGWCLIANLRPTNHEITTEKIIYSSSFPEMEQALPWVPYRKHQSWSEVGVWARAFIVVSTAGTGEA